MALKIDIRVPRYKQLFMPTFIALKKLGGSGSNNEILEQVIKDLHITEDVVDIPHISKYNSYQSELAYQLAWARTYLSKFGVIASSSRGIWSICPNYLNVEQLNVEEIYNFYRNLTLVKQKDGAYQKNDKSEEDAVLDNDETEFPDEAKPWRDKLSEILQTMDPFGFERLAQRILRESGFTQVVVTKKTGDGGIDGFGQYKINGIFSFNVAFQCKRYNQSRSVQSGEIRDFRGSLATNFEKGIFITTSTFNSGAKKEASAEGKKQIDLIDGEDLITKIAELGIGVKEVKTYEIDIDFFKKI